MRRRGHDGDPDTSRRRAHARRTIHTVSEYRDAQRTVDWLSDQGFGVERVSIVGTGLRDVESDGYLVPLLSSVVSDALLGALLGAALRLGRGVRRDVAPVGGMRAARYEIQVDDRLADDAWRLVNRMPARPG